MFGIKLKKNLQSSSSWTKIITIITLVFPCEMLMIIILQYFVMMQFLGRGIHLARNITYFIAYIAYGMYLIALGPLIPYLSELSGKAETQYSFLFIWRAAGMLTGAALFHKYQSWLYRPSYHTIIAFSFVVIASSNFFFLWSDSSFFQGFWSYIAAIPYFLVEVMIDLSIISIGKHVDQLFLIVTACFGIGALTAPIIIRIFGLNAYIVFAVIILALIPSILYLPSPEINKQQKKDKTKEQKAAINTKTLVLLCLMDFFFIGLFISKLAWASSYAVLACNTTKQTSTVFPSLYSAFNVGTKFVWLFLAIKGSDRLRLATRMLVVVSILSLLIAQSGWTQFALFFDSILIAVFISSVSSQIMAIGSEFGRPLTEDQAGKIAVWGKVGEGMLTMLCGTLMNFNINIYYFFSIAACLALWLCSQAVIAELKEGGKTKEQAPLQMHFIE